MGEKVIKVFLVEDHELVRAGFRQLLEASSEFNVVGETANGEEALKLIAKLRPAVVLMDVFLQGMSGIETTSRITRAHPKTKVIGLSAHAEAPFPCQMTEAGAMGFLTKNCTAEELYQAIRSVAQGQPYISMDLARSLSLASLQGKDQSNQFTDLGRREMQVLIMIVEGKKNQEMADALCLSSKTISTYRQRLYSKLGVKTDVELTHLAIRHGILDKAPDDLWQ